MRKPVYLLLRTALTLTATSALAIALFAVVRLPATAFIIEDFLSHGRWPSYDWCPASRISPHLLVAVVAAEDQRFAEHSGFDLSAIEDAAKHNRRGGSVRGASTISQQVAKNVFLWPGRSYLRKGLEAVLTVMIEKIWSKQRILEVYVNVAQLGPGVFGAEAASQRFFHKEAANLTVSESALLAAVLPNPDDMHADAPSSYLRHRGQAIEKQMAAIGGDAWLLRLR